MHQAIGDPGNRWAEIHQGMDLDKLLKDAEEDYANMIRKSDPKKTALSNEEIVHT